jgi:hypothetical protein
MVGNCVHCAKGSELQLAECSFANVDGNDVTFELSHGFLTQSTFVGFTFPAIIVSGITSNPVISDCRVSGRKTFGIAARDASTAVFYNLTLERIHGNGFSISQLSRAFVVNCLFSRIGGTFVSAFDGANPTIVGKLHSHPAIVIGESIVMKCAKSPQQPQINRETPMTFDDLMGSLKRHRWSQPSVSAPNQSTMTKLRLLLRRIANPTQPWNAELKNASEMWQTASSFDLKERFHDQQQTIDS